MTMRFTLKQIEYFCAVGATGSIALASERLNISSPSISTAISQLEAAFGIELFVRHHAQGVSLTAEGRRFLDAAKRLIAQANELHGVADELARSVSGPLSIGCLIVFASLVLPELRRSFEAEQPAVSFSSLVGHQSLLFEKLHNAEIDVAVTYDLEIPPSIDFEPLAILPAHVIVSPDSKIAREREVALADLVGEPLILLDLPASREYFLSLYEALGLKPRILERVADYDLLRSMVASNFGYAISNIRPLAALAPNGLPIRRLRIKEHCRPMTLGLATIKGRAGRKAVNAFKAHCRALISTDHIPGMGPLSAERESATVTKLPATRSAARVRVS
ncbi:MAG TPA: LysR family transcriptional regulator [Xanthobacteraceae bacterium]|nr:LysR family transcriptional regulator [Xanthobacteraceae bacterium]